MKLATKQSALLLALLALINGAHATALVFGTPTANVDIVASSFGGTLLDSATALLSNSGYTGTARTAVYGTSSGLDFYYQFSNYDSSLNGLERFTAFDFSSLNASAISVFQTGSAFDIFSAGTNMSTTADRSVLGVIGFNFAPIPNSKINPGTTSFTQIIRTNARQFTAGDFGLIDAPGDNGIATAVPEPESYAMLLAGLGMVGAAIRRRKAKQA